MSLAMKYAMKKKMAKGGMCYGDKMADGGPVVDPEKAKKAEGSMRKAFNYAEGGEVEEKSEYDPVEDPQPVHNMAAMIEDDDMIQRIMKKRYSQGGEVANDVGEGEDADKEPNQFDDLVKDDDLEFHDTEENSGDDLGDEQEDDDRKDIVSRIMKSRAKKDKMPRPA